MDTSAEARVVASFTLITALLMGAWGALDQLLAGPGSLVPITELGRFLAAAVPFVATAVAVQATGATQVAWARAVGGAASMLGVLACAGAVLYLIAYT